MLADAIDEIFVLLRRANKYIDETTPRVLAKDPAKAGSDWARCSIICGRPFVLRRSMLEAYLAACRR